jgi:regulator of RNase E activity RraA
MVAMAATMALIAVPAGRSLHFPAPLSISEIAQHEGSNDATDRKPARISAVDRHTNGVQPRRDRGAGAARPRLYREAPALPVSRASPDRRLRQDRDVKAKHAVPLGQAGYMQKRLDYLDYVASAPQPGIMVMQDLDGEHAGYGAFWGEVQSNVHKALGCLGVVTSGSIRDIPMIAPGFQMLAGSIVPSHAYAHVVDYGIDVNVHGMAVKSGDLIHADRHGAVVVPADRIDAMKAALEGLAAREARIIAAAKAGGGVAAIKAAMTG